eukprot:TRINITY_DN9361_c0_g2_i1.p1 TRINITY_DN9361_c0_g2~~TRINITY_DN9361_c0_g2_i1.p1  ORF type:complete len:368 (+),score=146.47 TRINITY_DN9361_c0_g2_i1:550-1653(+)
MEAIDAEQQRQEHMSSSRTLKPSSYKNEASMTRSKHLHRSVQHIEPQTKSSLTVRKSQDESVMSKDRQLDLLKYKTLMQQTQNKEFEKQKSYDAETQQINEQLENYQRRLNAANMKVEAKNTSRMIVQLSTDRPADVVSSRRHEIEQEAEERRKAQYIKKTQTIESCKQLKGKAKEESKRKILAEMERRKQHQAENYKSAREREEEEMAAVQGRIDRGNENVKARQSSLVLYQRETGSGFNEPSNEQEFKQQLQMENNKRISRINEYKRNKILEKHMLLSLKNEQKKAQLHNAQNDALAKHLMLQKDMDLVYDCLSKMKKADPRDPKQRTLLLDAMNRLNDHFHLNLDLVPKSEKKRAKEEEENSEC